MGYFIGTFVDQENQFNSPTATVSDPSPMLSPSMHSNNPPTIAPLNFPPQGPIIPVFTTIVTTATVQADPRPRQTVLDGSTFGGPGGDLTNIANNNAAGFSENYLSQSNGNVQLRNNTTMMAILFVLFLVL